MKKLVACSQQLVARGKAIFLRRSTRLRQSFGGRAGGLRARAFTLVETLVAISVLTISIVAPMSLTTQSLSSAYYARDQITAFHLAQEAIESVRHVRDKNVLKNAMGIENALGNPADPFEEIPDTTGQLFIINTIDDTMGKCSQNACPPLQMQTSGLYGYRSGCITSMSGAIDPIVDCVESNGWTNTRIWRTVKATVVQALCNPGPSCNRDDGDEVHIEVTVSWNTKSGVPRTFTISENLYKWTISGSAAP